MVCEAAQAFVAKAILIHRAVKTHPSRKPSVFDGEQVITVKNAAGLEQFARLAAVN
jgi:hypothetical protein